MMYAWSFAARTADEVGRLVRALGRHRYLREADLRLHFLVDRALADLPAFAPHAAAFRERLKREPDLDLRSRDPSLYRACGVDDAILALSVFWTPDTVGLEARARLVTALAELDLDGSAYPTYPPFQSPPEEPPHPELVLLDWVLLPVDELDPERHAGALGALEDSGDEIAPSAPIYQEATVLSAAELLAGAPNGALVEDFVIWSDGPYAYSDYVFRGAAKAAKLVEPPVGYRDF
jgi:hypothetical protein